MVSAPRVRLGDERGATLVLVAVTMIMLYSIAAISVDLGRQRAEANEASNVADAGALAGASSMPGDPAGARDLAALYSFRTLQVSSYAQSGSCGADCQKYVGDGRELYVTAPYTASGTVASRTINVKACWDFETSFGGVVGVKRLGVCRDATAMRGAATPRPCGLCVLDPSGLTLSSTGAGALRVVDAMIQVNSSSSTAAKITNPNAGGIKAEPSSTNVIQIVGGYNQAAPDQFYPAPATGVAPIPDPYAWVPVPSIAGPMMGSFTAGASDATLLPGIYDSITSSKGSQINLSPGLYVIRQSLKLNQVPDPGKVSLVGNGVMLYFACSNYPQPCANGESGAGLTMTGGATLQLSAPTSGTYQGMGIFYDRENESSLILTGSSATSISGTIYLRDGTTSLTGPSGVFSLTSSVVTGDLIKTGDSEIRIQYDPALVAPTSGIQLVE